MSPPHRNDGDDRGAPGSTGAPTHGHVHGRIDPAIASTDRGLWAVKWSFIGLMLTALLQAAVVAVSRSVALLADTIHNVADAATAIPLAIAFTLARRQPSRRFPYGLGRVEDLAGIAIVATILASAIVAAWESVARLLRPQPIEMLWAVMLASVVGFLGHELLHHLPHLGSVVVHVDPAGEGGERHHRISEHAHDGLPVHSHP